MDRNRTLIKRILLYYRMMRRDAVTIRGSYSCERLLRLFFHFVDALFGRLCALIHGSFRAVLYPVRCIFGCLSGGSPSIAGGGADCFTGILQISTGISGILAHGLRKGTADNRPAQKHSSDRQPWHEQSHHKEFSQVRGQWTQDYGDPVTLRRAPREKPAPPSVGIAPVSG